MPLHRLRWLAPGLALLLAAGCASVATTPTAAPEHAAALVQLEQGQAREAAQRLEALANATKGSQRNALLADAAFAWHEAGDDARARTLVAQLDPRKVGGASRARLSLLQAELALAAQQPAGVQAALVGDPATLPAPLQARWYLASGKGLEATGDTFGAAAARARADAGLAGEARDGNRREIERLLSKLDDATLSSRAAALPAGDPLYNFAGRALVRRGLPLPRPFERGENWDFAQRAPAAADGYRPPRKLAVLLPLSGQLATAAGPVRDGLLAGYYAESRARPPITFYDTTGTPAGALAAYAKAVADGNDFVIGPLGRDDVGAVFAQPEVRVSTLALNRGNVAPPPGNIAFSLAPEDDGIAAADYLLAREHRNVLVIGGSDENGRRAVDAFRERLGERGGKVASVVSVSEQPGDVSAQLAQAAAAGADSVFLAVRGPQARALVPQLAMAGFASRTRVAGSQLVSGTGKASEDVVLDGIVFPGEAWAARGVAGLPSHSQAAEMLPTARGGAARLFAFGHDAWLITAFLERLVTRTDGELAGATGTLRLDGFGNVVRQPQWSIFSGGVAVPLAGSGH
ncbi:penicillin-binding protein activator [Pseudoxanthomonas daejeonensis]|uniref:penicillin-binding protein activator n=1 Tax=Pseudoxanthomonas daejeonensis TaxID=266062 RepID=UPI001F5422A3|nr:penicillin-binding protein activator [Pseudoxanthomonas daejeonensis]UNK59092.1 penicillin-binding protein activator [Pseudoxanthomonas daejeonensis]